MTNEIKMCLVAVRTHLSESQKSVASRFGLSANTWQSYELGSRAPKPDVLEKLIALGISIDWLLTGEGEMLLERRSGPLAGKGRVDAAVLAAVLTALEGWLVQNKQTASADDKAKAAAALYDAVMMEAGASTTGRKITAADVSSQAIAAALRRRD